MLVKDLTIEELKLLIQETVAETIQSLLIDPDEGRQVKPEVKQQLLNSLHRTQAGERGISALGSCKEIGLELVMTARFARIQKSKVKSQKNKKDSSP